MRKAVELSIGVFAIAMSPNGRRLASSTFAETPRTGIIDIWTYPDMKLLREYSFPGVGADSLAFSPDGRSVATNVFDNGFLLLSAMNHSKRAFTGSQPGVGRDLGRIAYGQIAYSPDGKTIAVGGGDPARDAFLHGRPIHYPGKGGVVLWDVARRTVVGRFSAPGHWVRSVTYSPDGRLLASGGGDGDIILWNVQTGRIVREFRAHKGEVAGLAFSSDGRRLLSGGGSYDSLADMRTTHGDMKLWDVTSGRLIATFIVLRDQDWIVYTPQGYYECSHGAGAYLKWRNGNRIVPFEEYARKYHRPDLLRNALSRCR
jgi:hypothetical protein